MQGNVKGEMGSLDAHRNIGMLENWRMGKNVGLKSVTGTHHSIIPSFHQSFFF
jgi:hypothetical protein